METDVISINNSPEKELVSFLILPLSEAKAMKQMVWQPEERDQRVNKYLDKINHAPYQSIVTISIVAFCLFTAAILIGIF